MIKYIFGWQLKSSISQIIENYIISDNLYIKAFKNYYRIFRNSLRDHDFASLKKIINLNSNYLPINKFIESLKKDYNSVINTAKYKYNNSQVEGQVCKIKRIKHHMYGRASIKILKNKAVYQSHFF